MRHTNLIKRFFGEYVTAFLKFDSSYISDAYDFPMVFYAEDGESITFERDEFSLNTKKLFELYKKHGVENISFSIDSVQNISKLLELVSINWNFQDEKQQTIYKSCTRYLIKNSKQGYKIKSVFVINETTELNRLADR